MEREVIQSVGFHNIVENGETVGFQFKIRLPYYRGVFLSQLRPGALIVDGERIEKDQIVWSFKGFDYTWHELREDWKTHWCVTEPMVIKVKKPGGLAQGYHDLTYGFCFTSSYMAPILQNDLDPDRESKIFMPEFGHHVNKRRLIIV